MRVAADLDACQGYLNCLTEAPDLFDVDDDGKVVVLDVEPPESQRVRAQAAVRACPARALTLTED